MWAAVNFHVQENTTNSKQEVHFVITEQLFNALKAIETSSSDAMKVYGLPESINLHIAFSLGYYCLISAYHRCSTRCHWLETHHLYVPFLS